MRCFERNQEGTRIFNYRPSADSPELAVIEYVHHLYRSGSDNPPEEDEKISRCVYVEDEFLNVTRFRTLESSKGVEKCVNF